WIAGKVLDSVEIRFLILAAQNPAYVRPPESFAFRRMHVHLLVGVLVVVAVMRRPPQRPHRCSRTAQPGDDELKKSTGPIRPVGKIAVIACRDAKHPDHIERQAQSDGFPRNTREEASQANQVNSDEWQALNPLDAALLGY